MLLGFIRHDIPAALVTAAVDAAVERHGYSHTRSVKMAEDVQAMYEACIADGRTWNGNPPSGVDAVDAYYQERVRHERAHYGTVRVLERLSEPLEEVRFRLIYGMEPDSAEAEGTGPFASLEEAQNWFTHGGR